MCLLGNSCPQLLEDLGKYRICIMESQFVKCCICILQLLVDFCEVLLDVNPRLFNDGPSRTFYDVAAKNVMLGYHDKPKLIIYAGENSQPANSTILNMLFDLVGHLFHEYVFCAQLLWRDLPVDLEEMDYERAYFG